MALRDLRLGAFLVPLAVSAVPVGVLVWYGLVHIPSQERYLNERNLRLLMTASGNIAAAVDNFDNALDHGVESFWDQGKTRNEEQRTQNLAAGVRMFAPDLQIVRATAATPNESAAADIEDALLNKAQDPPYIKLVKDEGHWSLYVAARRDRDKEKGGTLRVLAKSDVETVVQQSLRATQSDFDAVLLVAQNGDVIARRSPIGIGLSSIVNVLKQRGDRRATDRNGPETTFESVRDFSNVMPLAIGGAEYKLYLQPVPLSLVGDEKGKSDGWVICGLVRADRFRAETSALSYPTLLWFSAALCVVLLAIPFVKLHVLRPRERLHANDAGWVTAAMFVSIGLLAITVLHAAVFMFVFPGVVDDRLARVSTQISDHVIDEVSHIADQRKRFTGGADVKAVSETLGGKLPTVDLSRYTQEPGKPPVCDPKPACGPIAFKPGEDISYPFIYQASWFDRDGRQLVKQAPGVFLTPFINMNQERMEVAADVNRAWQSADASSGVSVLKSPNTGRPITVFWRVPERSARVASESIALYTLVSLSRPMLPKGVSFAVVNAAGRTIFHSDVSRNLQEDFLKECEDNDLLRAAIGGAPTPPFTASYLGRDNRLLVRRLTLPGLTNDPRWSLVVFQDARVADTLDLETVTLACILFFAFGAALAIASLLLQVFAPRGWMKWFWPSNGKTRAYAGAAWLNAIAAVVLVVSAAWLPPLPFLALTITVAIGALFLTRWMVLESGPGEAPRDFDVLHPYFVARAMSLLVLAALPAIACYHVAYTFETRLLATSERTHHKIDNDGRRARIRTFVNRFTLADDATSRQFFEAFDKRGWDQIDAPLWPLQDVTDRCTRCEGLLARIHPPYDEVAIDLKAAAGDAKPAEGLSAELQPSVLILVVAGLFFICFVFVYVLLRPLFALRGIVSAGPTAPRTQAAAHRLLIVGPPGSGKSTQLAAVPGIRVFDIARHAFLERRRRQVVVPLERRNPIAVAAAAGAGVGAAWWSGWTPFSAPLPAAAVPPPVTTAAWADAFDYNTLPRDGTLGIDHLDYRLDDREFAAQTLRFLEHAIQTEASVCVVCDRDPLLWLAEYRAPAAEIDRWARVLASFEQEVVSVGYSPASEAGDIERRRAACPSLSREQAREAQLVAMAPHYKAVWRSCMPDEQLALCQLAQEGVINPQSYQVVRRLMRVGLVVRDPAPHLMVDSFRRFIVQAPGVDDLAGREHVGVSVPWGSVKAALMTVVAGLAGLLIVTQQQLVSAWIGFVPALMPAAQRAWTLFSSVRTSVKGEGTA